MWPSIVMIFTKLNITFYDKKESQSLQKGKDSINVYYVHMYVTICICLCMLGAHDSEPNTTTSMTIQGDRCVYGITASRMSVGHMEVHGQPESKSEG